RGEVEAKPQDGSLASMTRPLRKEDGKIDWTLSADVIARHVRAMFPWPGAATTAGGNPLKILQAKPVELVGSGADAAGTVRQEGRDALVVTGHGAVRLLGVQPAGRKAMSGSEWLRGFPGVRGTVLGA
ncbi:MAG: methionyl-tRNA formyltransferase, partial [Chloroflexota bacterium]